MAVSDQKILPDEYDCGTSVATGDLVYINSGGLLQKARSNGIATMPAIGIVTGKLSATICLIQPVKLQSGLAGIVNKKRYFVSSTVAGAFQDSPPVGSSEVIQNVGIGIGTTKRQVFVDPTSIIIRNA